MKQAEERNKVADELQDPVAPKKAKTFGKPYASEYATISFKFTTESDAAKKTVAPAAKADPVEAAEVAAMLKAAMDEGLAEEEQYTRKVVQLGMTELGQLSFWANAKAVKLWPDHMVKIREALNTSGIKK